jgi:hypothetical protein
MASSLPPQITEGWIYDQYRAGTFEGFVTGPDGAVYQNITIHYPGGQTSPGSPIFAPSSHTYLKPYGWAQPSGASESTSTGVSPSETSYALYGHPIPISLGLRRIGGEIIAGPWIENGLASFIISFGFPADPSSGTRDLREIAFDSEVVWTAGDGFATELFTYRFYGGTFSQAADALEIAKFGAANAVAYRPQMLLVFENLPLANTKFKKIPYVAALIGDSTGDDINLGTAIERLAYGPWVGWTSDQFETSGITDGLVNGGLIITQQADFLSTIQGFARFYPKWDIIQTDKLRLSDRGANVAADITLDKTRLTGDVSLTRLEPNAAAREITLTTIDPDADYTLVASTAQMPRFPVNVTTSVKTDAAYLPAIMTAPVRQSVATYALYHEQQARKKISFTAMAYGLEIEPGVLASVPLGDDFNDDVYKIVETLHGANYTVECIAEALLRCDLDVTAVAHLGCDEARQTAATTHTFTDVDFGDTAVQRRIVVGINLRMAATGQTITGITIGGVSATAAVTASNAGQGLISAIYYASVPTGLSGDIAITCSGNFTEVSIHSYRIVSAAFAVHDTDSAQATTTGAVSVNVDILGGGVAISAAACREGTTFAWDGASANCTFANNGTTTGQKSSAIHSPSSDELAHPISVAPSSIDRITIAAASFVI